MVVAVATRVLIHDETLRRTSRSTLGVKRAIRVTISRARRQPREEKEEKRVTRQGTEGTLPLLLLAATNAGYLLLMPFLLANRCTRELSRGADARDARHFPRTM